MLMIATLAAKLASLTSLAWSVRRRREIPTNHAATSQNVFQTTALWFPLRFQLQKSTETTVALQRSLATVSVRHLHTSPRKTLEINSCNLPDMCACSVVTGTGGRDYPVSWQSEGGHGPMLGALRGHFTLLLILSH